MTMLKREIEKMKQWCMENYDNGADTMVECWEDKDYENLFIGEFATGLKKDAWNTLKSIASIYQDRQADARYYQENCG